MSPQRVADAANTHPYPFVVRQPRLPPDNADRDRDGKPKKSKPRPRTERNPRQEEEIRFNTGPRNLRGAPVNRGSRRPFRMLGRYDRGCDDQIGIPDYPPPSFQEAMTTPSLSACSSTTTVVPISRPTVLIPENISEVPEIPVVPPNIETLNETVVSDHGSDSDDSIQIIDKGACSDDLPKGVELEQRIRSDWKIRRGLDFPGPSYSDSSQNHRPLSASPYSSSYAASSRNIFFRSSINLASSSVMKLPLLSPSKSDNFFTRKLFGKGKEKLNNWEVLDEDIYPDEFEVEGDYPSSLMSAIQSLKLSPSFIVGNSPARSQSFNVGIRSPVSAPARTNQSPNVPQNGAMREELSSQAHQNLNASLRDRKGPSGALLDRQIWRSPVSASTSTVSSMAVPLEANSPPAQSLSPVMHHRVPTPSPAPSVIKNTVPPIYPSSLRPTIATGDQASASIIHQQALDTPLPATPVHRTQYDIVVNSAAALNDRETPISARSVPDPLNGSISAGDVCTCRSIPPLSLGTANCLAQTDFTEEPMTPSRHHYTGRPLPRPPPSVIRSNIDSTFAPEVSVYDGDTEGRSSPSCPEGLLIDLDDTSAHFSERLLIDLDDTSLDGSGASTPLSDGARLRSQLRITTTPSSSVAGLTMESGSQDSPLSDSTVLGQSSSRSEVSQPFEATELDLLVSRIAHGENDGSEYETLLLVSELIGPANPTQPHVLPPLPATLPPANANANISLIGQIEVKCRRKTKDGRVKLKLSLLDVRVNECGICLSQFKDGDKAGLTSVCQHSFHEMCLARWLARNKSCPLCRVPLDVDLR